MSILSFPERGQGGDSTYRGNCSPKVYEWLVQETRARSLLDPVMGGGTSLDVALRLGLKASGSDLSTSPYHQRLKARLERQGARVELGVDATRTDLAALFGQHDLVVAHPAYGTQIVYGSGEGDMSQLGDGDAFLDALQAMTLNMREATTDSGYYVVIIGDTRKQGRYHSYQGPLLGMLPASELRAVRIKAQHNVGSAKQDYGRVRFGLTLHEYVLILQKELPFFQAFGEVVKAQQARLTGTWKAIVRQALTQLGGRADLDTLYDHVFRSAPDRVQRNPNFKAKVRQTLQLLPECHPEERGIWRLAAA